MSDGVDKSRPVGRVDGGRVVPTGTGRVIAGTAPAIIDKAGVAAPDREGQLAPLARTEAAVVSAASQAAPASGAMARGSAMAGEGFAPVPVRRMIVCGTRTGGQGKTLVSHLIAMFSGEVRILSADKADEETGRSKIGRFFEQVVEIGVGPTAEEVVVDPHKALAFWDRVGDQAMQEHVLIDLGAQVIDSLMDWARASDVGSAFDGEVEVMMVIPMTASAKAVADAKEIYQRLRKEGSLVRRFVFVRNFADGAFSEMDRQQSMQDLRKLVAADASAAFMDLPACPSTILRRAEERYEPLSVVLSKPAGALANELNMNLWDTNRQLKLLRAWVSEAGRALHENGVLINPGGMMTDQFLR